MGNKKNVLGSLFSFLYLDYTCVINEKIVADKCKIIPHYIHHIFIVYYFVLYLKLQRILVQQASSVLPTVL